MSNKNYNKMYDNNNGNSFEEKTSIERNVTNTDSVIKPETTEQNTHAVDVVAPVEPKIDTLKEVTAFVCNCKKLNVRKNPEMNAMVLMIIDEEDRVTVTGDPINNFYPVITESGTKGYCAKDYLKI